MLTAVVPQAVRSYPQITTGDVSFVHYRQIGDNGRVRVVFNQYAFIFCIKWSKRSIPWRTKYQNQQGQRYPYSKWKFNSCRAFV